MVGDGLHAAHGLGDKRVMMLVGPVSIRVIFHDGWYSFNRDAETQPARPPPARV